jgi:hypothetical protein
MRGITDVGTQIIVNQPLLRRRLGLCDIGVA